jgi:hypothetical protein
VPDLSAELYIPNPYSLRVAEFDYDATSYRAALGFLSDLSGGTDESRALEINGGNPAMLTGWKRSEKFRRVYAKCRAAGEVEREAMRARESAQEATEGDEAGNPSSQTFVPLESLPARPGVFGLQPRRESWGGM